MITRRKIPLIRAILLATALSTAVMAPAAFAETVEVMILNTRSADGIYRPALRVLRGGTVMFFNSGEGGLTEDIIRDGGALNAWLAANVPAGDGAEPVSFVVTKIESRPPVAKEPEPLAKDCFDYEKNGVCSEDERADYCESEFPGWQRGLNGWYANPEEYCKNR